jgi:hypothetical protein
MKDLRIFISYSHEDSPVATALSNLLQQAFGPSCEIFLDRSAISFGTEIKSAIVEALDRADVLIAIMTGGQPASALSWPAWEISRFCAGWDPKFRDAALHGTKEPNDVIGRSFVISNSKIKLGPEWGKRNIILGISEQLLSSNIDGPGTPKGLMANSEVLDFMKRLESMVNCERDYEHFFRERNKSLPELVADFKGAAYQALRTRIRGVSKPSKQLVVRYSTGPGDHADTLPESARVFSIGGASDIMGQPETDAQVFITAADGTPGSERYETTWHRFKEAVLKHRHGAYWCGVIEQAVIGAKQQGARHDPNLVLVSADDVRYRVIATTVTTFFNGDAEVSLYLIPGLKRRDRGDEETTRLLNCLVLVCRFRFAFLERSSTFYWRNFESARDPLRSIARDLIMELDYLNSEAAHANLEKPGAYEGLVTGQDLTQMIHNWREIDCSLRNACNAVIQPLQAEVNETELRTSIVAQLKRLFEQVKPFNSLLGAALARRMAEIFNAENGRIEGTAVR